MRPLDQKFVEDPLFLKWVFHNNPSVDQYWRTYISENTEEKEQIIDLKLQLSELSISDDVLDQSEKMELAKQILRRINFNQQQNKRFLFFYSFLKYASVALIFAMIGGLVVFFALKNQVEFQHFASQPIENPSSSQGPLLISSNGKNVNLKKSNSMVDYSQNGTVVLNNDSTIRVTDELNVLNQLVIPYGNQSKVILSDHSVVWLNAGSRLIYPTRFKGKTREVTLFGEAFFEVSKNEKLPFIVKTSDLEIKVLGTQFNVSAYSEDKVIQTVLAEGSVSIRRNNARFYDEELVLRPNQMASFSKISNDTKVYEVDVGYYTLWTKGLLSFDEVDYNRILKKVERFYNVRINFAEPNLGSIRISGKLDLKQERAEVFEYLDRVSLTKIEQINENQYIVNK
jgi:ferric-dicitrate binding protein FerR (iron transport regulator)